MTLLDTDWHHCSMKHDAIVEQGIPIHERVPIPDELIPEDSRVEIDAKIHAGYCMSSFTYNSAPFHKLTVMQSRLAKRSRWKSCQKYTAGPGRMLTIEKDATIFRTELRRKI